MKLLIMILWQFGVLPVMQMYDTQYHFINGVSRHKRGYPVEKILRQALTFMPEPCSLGIIKQESGCNVTALPARKG
jgi:hypothetical protein